MKLLQKTYPLVGIMLLLSGGIFLAESGKDERDEQLRSINEAYREVFAKADLFAEELENTQIWERMLNRVERYVQENAGGNKKLIKAFDLCSHISTNLIYELNGIYQSVFAKKSPSPEAWIKAASDVQILVKRRTALDDMSEILENTRYYISAQKKNNVKDVLLSLMSILEAILDQINKDFSKKYDKYKYGRRLEFWQ